ncbi:MAG: hypothetical protein ACODAC_11510 [Pseudomonadota bacterium]
MASQRGFQELVALFDSTGTSLESEMHFEQFRKLLGHHAKLPDRAGTTVKAAYAQVGSGLAVRGLVFFLFKVSDEGLVDPAFNLPLEYMAEHAGAAPDLGVGATTMACRSQNPVPWHAVNLWEPAGEGASHPAMLVQKAVWRNRLRLKPAPMNRGVARLPECQPASQPASQPMTAVQELEQAIARKAGGRGAEAPAASPLDAESGTAPGGRVAVGGSAPVEPAASAAPADVARLRSELQRQQQHYLAQVQSYREEISKLKTALRVERERNRRLKRLME